MLVKAVKDSLCPGLFDTLRLPSVSNTTVSTSPIVTMPLLRSAARTSDSKTRSSFIAFGRNSPRYKSSVGSDLTNPVMVWERTGSQVIVNCSPHKSMKATTPWAKATSLEKSIVAKVEPRATVTIKSKAFILDSVRFPEIRS